MGEESASSLRQALLSSDDPLSSQNLDSEATSTVQEQTTRVRKVHARLLSLDLFRGLIICIMAWDHTCHPFTNEKDSVHNPGSEIWEGPYTSFDNSPRKFLARVVSHVCAPGFFLTMGMSMIFFTYSRITKLNWTWSRVFKHHFIRGLVLLGVEYAKDLSSALPTLADVYNGREVWDWHGNQFKGKKDTGKIIYRSLLGVHEVMTALGFTMMLSQLAMPLLFAAEKKKEGMGPHLGLLLFCICFAASNLAIVLAQGDENISDPPDTFPHFAAKVRYPWEVLGRILFYPGQLFTNWELLIDPVFPWIGVVFLGMGLGFPLRTNPERTYKRMALLGLVFLVLFALVRGFGGKMNARGKQRGEESIASPFMQFFIQTKYPPDWAFAFITVGVDFLLLFMFSQPLFAEVEAKQQEDRQQGNDEESLTADASQNGVSFRTKIRRWALKAMYPLLVFGRTPMFFYITHVWVIQTLFMFFRIPDPPSGKFSLFPGVFLVWVTVLLIQFPMCRRYLDFKSNTDPESIWRLF